MTATVYDAGVLLAADAGDRATWADHRARLEAGELPAVPAVVVAQASRSSRQAQLRRFLRGCDVAALDEERAHRVGALLARAGTRDVVDAAVVVLAIERRAEIVTDDRKDIARLVAASRAGIRIVSRAGELAP